MVSYWLLFLIPLICFMVFKNQGTKAERNWYIVAVVLYAMIGAFRTEAIGTDTPHYVDIITGIAFGDTVDMEALSSVYYLTHDALFYQIYGWVYIILWHSVFGLFAFHAILHWTIFATAIKKHADNIFLALLVLIAFRFSDLYLNAMRQGISIAIVLFSYRFIIDRKMKWFLACMAVAVVFHKSTLLFMPAYWLYDSKYINLNKRFIFISIILALLLKDLMFENVFKYMFVDTDYELYLETKTEHGILYYTLYLVTFLFCLYNINLERKDNKFLLVLCFCAVLLQTICLVNPIFNRISAIYSIYFVFLVPRIYTEMKERYPSVASIVVIFMLALYTLGGPAPGIVPYQSDILDIHETATKTISNTQSN